LSAMLVVMGGIEPPTLAL